MCLVRVEKKEDVYQATSISLQTMFNVV